MATEVIESEVMLFDTKEDWEKWLLVNHQSSKGIWMRIAKKSADIKSANYQEALEIALCYGWIDGQKKSYDDNSWIQRFTARKGKSIWSKINKDKVELLIKDNRVKPAGLKAIEEAKKNGLWDKAYQSQKNITVPEDFQSELDKNEKAKLFFNTLNSSNRYSFLFRIETAKKSETRLKRINQYINMLEKGETFH